MKDGVYDQLIDGLVAGELAESKPESVLAVELEEADLAEYLVNDLAAQLRRVMLSVSSDQERVALYNEVSLSLGGLALPGNRPSVLRALVNKSSGNLDILNETPTIPLSQMALLTNAKGEPRMGSELRHELKSADKVDILMAFVKVSGLNLIGSQLKSLGERGVPVRLITSAYMGATEVEALDQLVKRYGVEVRVDYLARSNRLHAKAWLLERDSGFTTAYVGSSNLSNAALVNGLEWNVRFSKNRSPQVLEKIKIAFDSYWMSDDFEPYGATPEDAAKLLEALGRAKNIQAGANQRLSISNIEVRPWPFQQKMLDELEVERLDHQKNRNLVVAATGTGKTVLAALDYKRLRPQLGPARLLFVAHTKEILKQSRATFAQVLLDPAFGELWVDGQIPSANAHVFASIQSLTTKDAFLAYATSHFDFVVIDEFHHADAASYRKVIEHFKPKQFLGLTATPERSDGKNVQDLFFAGRVATELRLWDALDQELLAPFNYFGISDDVDYSKVAWSKGHYDQKVISNILGGDEIRAQLIFNQLLEKFGNVEGLKALAFCASREHAMFMTEFFERNNIPARTVLGETPAIQRDEAIDDFKAGRVKILFSVNVFNEGFDAPDANAILLLRPTESSLVFLQQLGRGLRKSPRKESVLVLDFVGNHRAEYRHDLRLAALTGASRSSIREEIEADFPYLPSGVSIELDRKLRNRILDSIKTLVGPSLSALAMEAKALDASGIGDFLDKSGREPWEIYRHNAGSWAGVTRGIGKGESLAHRASAFIHVNDAARLNAYRQIIDGDSDIWDVASDLDRRFLNMFFWNVFPDGGGYTTIDTALADVRADEAFTDELRSLLKYLSETNRQKTAEVPVPNVQLPLRSHANYSRTELLGALGWSTLSGSPLDVAARHNTDSTPDNHREGVAWMPGLKLELLLVTLQKGERFSATTRYKDYAENQNVFHWDSQNRTTPHSETGKRYINQVDEGVNIMLALRESEKAAGRMTATYRLVGLCDYIRHEGSAPMSIWWNLRERLDLETWQVASAVRVA